MLKQIEFLGIPGAGKTYMLKKMAACLHKHGKHAYPLEEAVYQAFKTTRSSRMLTLCTRIFPYRIGYHLLRRFPRTADDLSYLAFQRFLQAHSGLAKLVLECHYHRARNIEHFDFLSLLWFFDLFSKYQLVIEELHSEEYVILFDEGFSQRVVTLFGYDEQPPAPFESLETAISHYIENIPRPHIIFVLATSLKSVESRMKTRGYPIRMQTMTSQERTQYLRHAAACINIAVERFRQYDVRLIEIDNNGTEADLLFQLQQSLHDVVD